MCRLMLLPQLCTCMGPVQELLYVPMKVQAKPLYGLQPVCFNVSFYFDTGKLNKAGDRMDVWENFRDYKLTAPVGLIRADAHSPPFRPGLQVRVSIRCSWWKPQSSNSYTISCAAPPAQLHRPCVNYNVSYNVRPNMCVGLQDIFDAIICDPPYGVRAGGKKSVPKSHPVTCTETHIPSTDPYTFEECLSDLLHLAAKHLKLGGRLVFFLPSAPGVDKVCLSTLPYLPVQAAG